MKAEIPHGPCSTCPYACATPPGVWDPEEYARLPAYDGETFEQPHQEFYCHYDNGNLCGGWLATHDPQELLAIRVMIADGTVSADVMDYETDVPCYASSTEAAEAGTVHGPPGPAARAAITQIENRRARRA